MLSVDLVLIIAICSLVILLFAFILKQKVVNSSLLDKLHLQESLINEQIQSISAIEECYSDLSEQERTHFNENSEVTKQLEHRISKLKQQVLTLEEQVGSFGQQSSEDKFYARALKLAKKGADVEEIVIECEIPRAEAEMLLAVHQRKK